MRGYAAAAWIQQTADSVLCALWSQLEMPREWITRLRLRLRALIERRRLDEDLDDELRFHVASREQQLRESGLEPAEAARLARRRFGNETNTKEAARDLWTFPAIESIWKDLRYGARVLRKNPLYTAVAVLSLALGIGANTAVFTLVKAVILDKLPVKAPDELVIAEWRGSGLRVRTLNGLCAVDMVAGGVGGCNVFDYGLFQRLRERATQFTDIFGFSMIRRSAVYSRGRTEIVSGMMVSGDYYHGLGVQPLMGRLLNETDDLPGAEPVAVISYELWRDLFESDPDALGTGVTLNNAALTIVGVTRPGFYGVAQGGFMGHPDITVPLAMATQVEPTWAGGALPLFQDPGRWWINVMGRMRPGVNRQAAEAELRAIFVQEVGAAHQLKGEPLSLSLLPGSQGLESFRGYYSSPLWTLLAAAALVLLLACANVATLLLSRSSARRGEITLRLAIGAGRGRLVRQLLTESLLLSLTAGAIGAAFSYWGGRLLLTWLAGPDEATRISLSPDIPLLAFVVGLAVLTGVVFGLAPAVRASRAPLSGTLKESSGAAPANVRRERSAWLPQGAIVVQVALSLILIVGAGLFVRTLRSLRNVDVGFSSDGVLLFALDPSVSGYDAERTSALYHQVLDRLNNMPAVLAASASSMRLLTGWAASGPVSVPESASLPDGRIRVLMNHVAPRFFETVGIPLRMGRDFNARDTAGSPRVAVVNQALADRALPGGSPLGRVIQFSEQDWEIIGVTANALFTDLKQDPPPTVYLPYEQIFRGNDMPQLNFAVRTAGPPEAFTPSLQSIIHELDPRLPLIDVETQQDVIDGRLRNERLFANLSSVFGLLALLLASIGIYGVVAYAVSRRTGEVGIRMALGAQGGNIVWLMLRRIVALVALGVMVGVGGALVVTRLVESMLWGVTPNDPTTFVAAAALLILVALTAGFFPARRAARIHPMDALRCG